MHLEDIGLMFIVLCEKQQRVCRKVWHLVESIAIFTICMKAFLYQGTLSEGFNIKSLLSHKKIPPEPWNNVIHQVCKMGDIRLICYPFGISTQAVRNSHLDAGLSLGVHQITKHTV